MTTHSSPKLDYAPVPRLPRGAHARRLAVVAGAMLLLGGTVWVTPRAVRRAQVVYWLRQCMGYAAPASQVVYENNPAEIPKLLAPPTQYEGSLALGHAFLIPPMYRNFAGNLNVSRSVGTTFLHERATPQGKLRLVAVEFYYSAVTPNARSTLMSFMATTFDPTSMLGGPRQIMTTTSGDGQMLRLGPGDALRVFAGQPDPADASHFTIDYVLNDTRHTLDGWLVDEQTVKLELRD